MPGAATPKAMRVPKTDEVVVGTRHDLSTTVETPAPPDDPSRGAATGAGSTTASVVVTQVASSAAGRNTAPAGRVLKRRRDGHRLGRRFGRCDSSCVIRDRHASRSAGTRWGFGRCTPAEDRPDDGVNDGRKQVMRERDATHTRGCAKRRGTQMGVRNGALAEGSAHRRSATKRFGTANERRALLFRFPR